MNIAVDIIDLAKESGVILATSESCTAGMVAVALTDVAGSSAVFERGFVTYSNAAKIEMLGVSSGTLKDFGAVSEEVAAEMASGAIAKAPVQLAVAITGIAGPGGSEHKPEGRVCFGIAVQGDVRTETIEFGALGRGPVRSAARDHALRLLYQRLQAGGVP